MRMRLLKRYEKALVACIKEKWKPLASGKFEGDEPECVLCILSGTLQRIREDLGPCSYCPLKVFSEALCYSLGYNAWGDALDNADEVNSDDMNYNDPEVVAAAKVMLGNLRKCLRKVRAAIRKQECK